MRERSSRIFYLEGIRGVAAVVVFLNHFVSAFLPAYNTQKKEDVNLGNFELAYGRSLFSVLTNGDFAVYLFFVLSGYVLSRQYLLSGRVETLVSAAGRRFLRLYIPVAATIILSYLLIKAGLYYNVPVGHLAHSERTLGDFWITAEPTKMLLHALLYRTMFWGDNFFSVQLWTMSVELFGSMLVFMFLALTHGIRNRGVVLITMMIGMIMLQDYQYSAFLFGISLHLVRHWEVRGAAVRTVLSIVLFFAGVVFAAYPAPMAHLPHFTRLTPLALKGLYYDFGAVLMIASLFVSPRLQRAFGSAFCRFLGYISFSFYLIHFLVIGSLGSFIVLRLYQHIGWGRAVLVSFVVTTTASIVAAYFMTKWIDEPGVRFSKWVYDRWFRKAEVSPPQETVIDKRAGAEV